MLSPQKGTVVAEVGVYGTPVKSLNRVKATFKEDVGEGFS